MKQEDVGPVAHIGEKRNACRVLVGTPEGETPLGSRRRRKENNKQVKKTNSS